MGLFDFLKRNRYADEIDEENALLSASTRFILNTDDSTVEESEYFPKHSDEASEAHQEVQLQINEVGIWNRTHRSNRSTN